MTVGLSKTMPSFTNVFWTAGGETQQKSYNPTNDFTDGFFPPKIVRDPVTAGYWYGGNQPITNPHHINASGGRPEYFASEGKTVPAVGGVPRLDPQLLKFSRNYKAI